MEKLSGTGMDGNYVMTLLLICRYPGWIAPGKWDLPVLEKLGFEVISVREEYPQKLLKYGIAQGYYTDFMIVALNRPGQASDEAVENMKRQEECCLYREEG